MGPGFTNRRARDSFACALETARREVVALEFVAEPLDLLVLAVHVDDVVAEEELEVFAALAWKTQRNRLELEKQIVPERPGESEFIVVLVAEFLRQRAQNGKDRRLLAALLFREQFRHRFERAVQGAVFLRENRPSADDRAGRRASMRLIAAPRSFSGRNVTSR